MPLQCPVTETNSKRSRIMHLSPLTLVFIILSLPPSQTTVGQVPAVRVRTAQLDRTPFTAGPLKLTLTQFRASYLKIGSASVEVQVVNSASTFTSFSPQRLSDRKSTRL